MLINLSPIINGRYDKEAFEDTFELNVEHGKRVGALHVSPIAFKGEVSMLDDKLFVTCHYCGEFTFSCDRCLEEVKLLIEDDFETRLITAEQEEYYDGYVVENETLDIVELVSDELLTHMPLHVLCRENCRGICATCGKNLNEGECNCDDAHIDPRFEVLKDLFSK
ncbi:MAG: DUF177 domain-containing protein [Clostridia bacterium]|nr:DUF177 domain-containing protein [Clostridia bacterium]